jgi:FkbM family methyltransferase
LSSIIKLGIRTLRSSDGRKLLREFGVIDALRLLFRREFSISFGSRSIKFTRGELLLYLSLVFYIRRLENLGFKITANSQDVMIDGYPYLQEPLLFRMDSQFSRVAFDNALQLLMNYCKYGGFVVDKSKRPPRKGIALDLNEMIVTTYKGINFFLEDIDPWTITETFLLNIHESEVRGKTVIDIGAQAGDTALYFASKGAEKVYAVEPIQTNFSALIRNLQLNPALSGKIIPIKAALGPSGKLLLKYFLSPSGLSGTASGFSNEGEVTEEVESYTLGDLLKKQGIPSVDVLKMDCKGCEWLLTKEDIEKVNEQIKIEWSFGNREKVSSLLQLLHAAGFNTRIFMHNPRFEGKIDQHGTIVAER